MSDQGSGKAGDENGAQVRAPHSDQPHERTSEPAAGPGSGLRAWRVLLTLFVVAFTGAVSYGVWWVAQQQAGFASELEQLRAAVRQEEPLVQDLRDQQQAIQQELDQLHLDMSRGALVRALIEADSLVRIAHDHLTFAHDLVVGIEALAAAEQRLQGLDEVGLLGVKTQLAEALRALRAVNTPDISRLALQLKSWAGRVEELPLAQGENVLPPPAQAQEQPLAPGPYWRTVLQGLWAELRGLVTIRHRDRVAAPLITPEQQYFLYQNLRLELEAAQLSLLRRDTRNLHASLGAARNWINRYFEVNAAACRSLLDDLSALEKTDIAPLLPELSGLQQALREALRAEAGSGAPQQIDSSGAVQLLERNASTRRL